MVTLISVASSQAISRWIVDLPGHSIAHMRRGWRSFTNIPVSPEILVDFGRMVTAAFGVIAIWFDPTRPTGEFKNVQIVLACYLSFSLLKLALSRHGRGQPTLSRWATHAIDIAALSLLVLFSEELDSPFFVFFTFTLITAALQWGMGGIVATALALQILLATSALVDLQDGDSELNVLIMRSAYCWVSVILLGYFAAYRERTRSKLAKLAAWQPEGLMTAQDKEFSRSLDDALEILTAHGIAVLWKSTGAETGFALVHQSGARGGAQHIRSNIIDELEVIGKTLIVKRSDNPPEFIAKALEQLTDILAEGQRPFPWKTLCVTKLRSTRHQGALIVIDGMSEREQLAALANIVNLRIAAHLSQIASASEQAEAASLRERERLARDLHDGVLQHLTAAAIHLKVAQGDHRAQTDRLSTVAEILLSQQQQIRQFVEGTRASATGEAQPLGNQLRRLASSLGRHWDCEFEADVAPPSLHLDNGLVTELSLLLSEAGANAVRHGQAQHVRWDIRDQEEGLTVVVEDDGCGLSNPDQAQMVPRSVSARVKALGGRLEISSKGCGMRLTIHLRREAIA